jgi:hypothetical protein
MQRQKRSLKLAIEIPKEEDIWECIQLINGDTFIFHHGFKEEASARDVFKFSSGVRQDGHVVYQFSRFDFNPAKPADYSTVRLNRTAIALAWYIDSGSDVIINLKRSIMEMNANKAGLLLPGQKG